MSREDLIVGNNDSFIYHSAACRLVPTLRKENRLAFDSVGEALNGGYRPCRLCQESDGFPRPVELSLEHQLDDQVPSRTLGEAMEESLASSTPRLILEGLKELMARHLSERERQVIVLCYGLDENEPRTLTEIGRTLGLTRERVRQIRNRAVDRIRRSPGGEGLRLFWTD